MALALVSLLPAVVSTAAAHEVRPASLVINEVEADTYRIKWKVPGKGDRRLAIDPVFDQRCTDKDEGVSLFDEGAAIRSWTLSCTGGLAASRVGFSRLSATMVDVLVQVRFLDGREHTVLVRPSAPSFEVPERSSAGGVFFDYLMLGIEHILKGVDHLLFVLALTLLLKDWRRLALAITGFTVAHSVTLALAMLDVIRIPGPPVEAVIALSIVFLAVELHNVEGSRGSDMVRRKPWLVAMAFGLVHGLGFASALAEYGLPVYAKFMALAAFNLGVETGQMAFVGTVLVVLALLRRAALVPQVLVHRGLTYFIGICGAYWMSERVIGFYI